MRAFLQKRKPNWIPMKSGAPHCQPRRDRRSDHPGMPRGRARERRRLFRCRRTRASRSARRSRASASVLPPPTDSYLSIPALIAAARATEADAIHPGYGFLSERAAFAQRVRRGGLIFVGPPADVIDRMGSKIGARALMIARGRAGRARLNARRPDGRGVLAAARAHRLSGARQGLGRRRRQGHADRARRRRGCREAVAAARREAMAAFGDGTLYVERLIERPRHVEVQVFADATATSSTSSSANARSSAAIRRLSRRALRRR